jgi:hypothetical protein
MPRPRPSTVHTGARNNRLPARGPPAAILSQLSKSQPGFCTNTNGEPYGMLGL